MSTRQPTPEAFARVLGLANTSPETYIPKLPTKQKRDEADTVSSRALELSPLLFASALPSQLIPHDTNSYSSPVCGNDDCKMGRAATSSFLCELNLVCFAASRVCVPHPPFPFTLTGGVCRPLLSSIPPSLQRASSGYRQRVLLHTHHPRLLARRPGGGRSLRSRVSATGLLVLAQPPRSNLQNSRGLHHGENIPSILNQLHWEEPRSLSSRSPSTQG